MRFVILLVNEIKLIFRSWGIWTYLLLLPLVLTLFSGVFSTENNLYVLKIGVVNEDNTLLGIFFIRYATSMIKGENIYIYATRREAEENLRNLDGYFIIPKGFANELLFQRPSQLIFVPNPYSLQSGVAIYQVLSNVLREFKALPVIADPNFMKKVTIDSDYKAPEIIVAGIDSDKFNFKELLFPLILTLSLLLTLGIGLSWSLHEDRQTEILDFLILSNVKAWEFIISKIMSFLMVGIFEFLIFIFFGLLFGYEGLGNITENALLFLVLSLVFVTMSAFLTSLAKTARGSQFLVTGISIVIILLSGIIVPRSVFPVWLKNLTEYFPMTALLNEIQRVSLMSINGETTMNLLFSNIVLSFIFMLLSFMLFRYRSDRLSAM
ncbi:ABC transporter permease [Kosmotoga pacifica]|uniref:ABC transmembrane type-2 domain-containing protein n=1 Tax=Kosmotoga pacifica TaxID=1330330 RepID=A0A0G2Z7J4_9BACT|nr:ABC transporter permease [Kosmotoga pacifica]AKI97517.1 hypothetical protein IX53_06475 [Kosmotoga pacifica]